MKCYNLLRKFDLKNGNVYELFIFRRKFKGTVYSYDEFVLKIVTVFLKRGGMAGGQEVVFK